MDNDQIREVRRLRKLLGRMMDLANHVEQTGSFESGAHDSVRRYNAIVEHLEDMNALPEDTFPRLEDDSSFGRLGAECTLLAWYLEDLLEEEDAEEVKPKRKGDRQRVDLGELVALAPFLASEDLHKLLHSHFDGTNKKSKEENEDKAEGQKPDMKQIVALAPHMASEDLEQLVLACLTRGSNVNSRDLTALAPHLSSKALGRILREYLPDWFEGRSEQTKNTADEPMQDDDPTISTLSQLAPYKPPASSALVHQETELTPLPTQDHE